jgi:hypothetical protein
MKINRRKPAATTQDLLITVARSIGSTLGAVAAKVSPWPRASHTGGRRVASAALSTISHPKATDAPLQGHRSGTAKPPVSNEGIGKIRKVGKFIITIYPRMRRSRVEGDKGFSARTGIARRVAPLADLRRRDQDCPARRQGSESKNSPDNPRAALQDLLHHQVAQTADG